MKTMFTLVSLYKIILSLYSRYVLPILSKYDFVELTKSSGLLAEAHGQVVDELYFNNIRTVDQLYWYLNELSFKLMDEELIMSSQDHQMKDEGAGLENTKD